MVTIVDVEDKSGVSRSTISRYLNGKSVRPENKRKIEQAIQELSYKRNPMASGLKSNKTFTVGCVLPDITDPFFPGIIKVFQEEMLIEGYQTILNTYGNDTDLEVEQVRSLANKRVDGLIVATSMKDGGHIQDCLDNNLPVILLDRLIDGLSCDSVTVDNYQSVYDAISLAIRKGHRKIGYIRGPEFYTDIVRFQGFKDALSKNGIDIPDDYVIHAELTEHDATRQFMHLMNLSDPPTLIFCSNVYLTMGAVEAMLEYNLDIPKDISVMVFDLLSSFPYYGFTKAIKPEFSSIVQPIEKIGLNTAELLLNRLEKGMNDYDPINIELKTIFTITESVANII